MYEEDDIWAEDEWYEEDEYYEDDEYSELVLAGLIDGEMADWARRMYAEGRY